MSRSDWKRGRFSVDYETNEIHEALRARQEQIGDHLFYYRFLREVSEMNDVYDEGTGVGRVYSGPFEVPALHVTQNEGLNENTDTGFYFNDDLYVTTSFRQLARIGFSDMDVEHQNYLKDRLVYSDKVFRVTSIHVLGQVQRRDIIASIEATQVKPDELVNDEQFARWSA